MSSWSETPIAFEPKRKPEKSSWWIAEDVQHDRAAFQAQVVAREIDRLNRRTSTFTHDKWPGGKK